MTDAIVIAGLVLANLAMAAGAAAQASIGMGLNLFTVPILALIDPVYVPGPVLLHSLLVASAASYRLRADIDRRELAISGAGLLVGTILAALLLTQINSVHLPRILGALVLGAVVITAAGYRMALTSRTLAAMSTIAGVMGTIAGVHGPPIALLYQHESPQRIRSALLPFFVLANGTALVALIAIGRFGTPELYASVLLVPGLVIGYLAAPTLIRVMSPRIIRACILAISAIGGLALLLKG